MARLAWDDACRSSESEIVRTEDGQVYISEEYAAEILEIDLDQLEEMPQFARDGSYLVREHGKYLSLQECFHLLRQRDT